MLFLIASTPDSAEFRTSYRTALEMKADICLMQNAVYASRGNKDKGLFVMEDDLMLRGIAKSETSASVIDYSMLVDMMIKTDRVIGLF